ncbi:hypothetical protein [Paenibacillus taichungensis]
MKKASKEKIDKLLVDIQKFIEAENQAFDAAGLEVGRVEFECPLCGGKAVGNRYMFGGRIGGLGSGCTGCDFSHT